MEQSLIEANKPRAIAIAVILSQRAESSGRAGAWHGYDRREGLDGVLVRDDILRYARPGYDNGNDSEFATLFFHEPKFTDTVNIDLGEEKHLEQDVIERYKSSITKIKGVEYDDKIQHTFSKTKTLQEAFKVAAEAAIKTSFEAGAEGVKAGAEVSLKISAEYSRQWGESETHTDTVERTLVLPADFEGDIEYEAIRSLDKVERTVKVTANADYRIGFVSGPVIPPDNRPYYDHVWESIDELISVGRGFAAADKTMYQAFMNNKLTQDEIDEIRKLGEQSVEFIAKYDNVNYQKITIL